MLEQSQLSSCDRLCADIFGLYWLLPRLTVTQLQSISLITPPGTVMLGWLLGDHFAGIAQICALTKCWLRFSTWKQRFASGGELA
jgi:hypothetical protein